MKEEARANGISVDDAGRIKLIDLGFCFLNVGGWKRTRMFQELRDEDERTLNSGRGVTLREVG